MSITQEELAPTVGTFTWNFGNKFHIETQIGNFEWSDPNYAGGDNTIRPCGTYAEWLNKENIEFGREKGEHIIGSYCPNFTLVMAERSTPISNPLSIRRVQIQTIDQKGKPVGTPIFGVMASDSYDFSCSEPFKSIDDLNAAIDAAPSILKIADNGVFSDEADHNKIKNNLDENGNYCGDDWMEEGEEKDDYWYIPLLKNKLTEEEPEENNP